MQMPRKFGWKPDAQDPRDFHYALPAALDARPVPPIIRLHDRDFEPPVWNQLNAGACTAFGHGYGAYIADQMDGRPLGFTPSLLAIYGHSRILDGDFETDEGAQPRNVCKALAKFGMFDQKLWPYDTAKLFDKGFLAFNKLGAQHRTLQYQNVPKDKAHIDQVLASGFPVIFGAMLYKSSQTPEVDKTGIVPMLAKYDEPIGGHCMAICGKDDEKGWYVVRNSWGAEMGDKGYYYFPYDYILGNLTFTADFRVIKRVA